MQGRYLDLFDLNSQGRRHMGFKFGDVEIITLNIDRLERREILPGYAACILVIER